MQALMALAPYSAVESTFARLLASERRRMVPALRRKPVAPAPPPEPWNPAEIALLAALGFFIASVLLHVTFA